MYIVGLGLFLLSLLPTITCHDVQSQSINRRDDGPVRSSEAAMDITTLLETPGTVVIGSNTLDTPETPAQAKSLRFRSPAGMIGIGPHEGVSLFMVSNYGIWGCPISRPTQRKMVRPARNQEKRAAELKPDEYARYFVRNGCYQKMRDQLATWEEDRGSDKDLISQGPPVQVPLAFFTTRWVAEKGFDRKPTGRHVPSSSPFIIKAEREVAAALQEYGAPTYLPILNNKEMTGATPDLGTVIRHLDLKPRQEDGETVYEKLVEVYTWSDGLSNEVKQPTKSGNLHRPILPVRLSSSFQKRQKEGSAACDPDSGYWKRVNGNIKIEPDLFLSFGKHSELDFDDFDMLLGDNAGCTAPDPASGPA